MGSLLGSGDPDNDRDLRSSQIQCTIGRAEALRQAMLGYFNDASSPKNAYPAFFALIGEGAAQ